MIRGTDYKRGGFADACELQRGEGRWEEEKGGGGGVRGGVRGGVVGGGLGDSKETLVRVCTCREWSWSRAADVLDAQDISLGIVPWTGWDDENAKSEDIARRMRGQQGEGREEREGGCTQLRELPQHVNMRCK